MLFEDLAQRRTSTQFDHEIPLGVLVAGNIVHFDDVRMPQLRGGPSFGDETLSYFGVFAKVLVDDLDRDLSAQAFVPGAIHRRHAAMPNLFEQLVLGEPWKRRQRGKFRHSTTLTRMEFVEPFTPMGAPKIATNLSPGETNPLAKSNMLARSTISSALVTLSIGQGTTPQSNARRRRVAAFGENAMMGTTGRCFDA